jgi:hypothetical protein
MPLQTPIDILMSLPEELGGVGESASVICRGRVVRTEPPRPGDPLPAVAAMIAGYHFTHAGTDDTPGNDPRRI